MLYLAQGGPGQLCLLPGSLACILKMPAFIWAAGVWRKPQEMDR